MPEGSASLGEAGATVRLMAILSPSFPTGAFAYSAGLETAFGEGVITDAPALEGWITSLLDHGYLWNDSVICGAAWHAQTDGRSLGPIQETAEATAPSAERYTETLGLGASFRAAAAHWPGAVTDLLPVRCALPLAVGSVAAAMGISLTATLAAFLQASLSNMVQAALRLAPLGQQRGVKLLVSLENKLLETSAKAGRATLDDLRSSTFAADIMAMRHETQQSRIFRS